MTEKINIKEEKNMTKGTLKIEREYKFLADLDKFPKALDEAKTLVSEVRIVQGYLTGKDDSIDLRLRKINNSAYFLTLKEGTGLERPESENEITQKIFENLWKNIKGRVIEKTRLKFRLKIKENEYVAEVDIYEGKHKGLVILEIEVNEGEVLDIKDLPSWIIKDVTGDVTYSNRYLACSGMPKE